MYLILFLQFGIILDLGLGRINQIAPVNKQQKYKKSEGDVTR